MNISFTKAVRYVKRFMPGKKSLSKGVVFAAVIAFLFSNGYPLLQTVFPIPEAQAYTFHNSTTASRSAAAAPSTTISFTHNNPSGANLLIVGVVDSLGTSPNPTVTFNGVNVGIVGAQGLVSGLGVRMYYLENPPVGSYTVQVTHSASVGAIAVAATSYNVNANPSAFIQNANQLGSGTCLSGAFSYSGLTTLGYEVFGARGDKDPATWTTAPHFVRHNFSSGTSASDVTMSVAELATSGSLSTCVGTSGSIGYVRKTMQMPPAPPAPQPPTITSSPPTSATPDVLYSYQATATDPNNDPLTWSLITAPAGMTVNSSGLVTWTPTVSDVGPHNVTLQVADNVSGVDQDSWTINVTLAGTLFLKSGSINTNASGSGSVSFVSGMPDTNYARLLAGGVDTDSMYSMVYLSPTASGFSVIAEDDSGATEQASNNQWMALNHGDFDVNGNAIKCGPGGGAAGDNVLTFASAFSNTNYSILATSADDTDSPAVNLVVGSKQAGQATIRIEDDGGATEAVSSTQYCAFLRGEYSAGGANIKSGGGITAGSGDTTVPFTSPFPDTNYTVVAMAEAINGALCAPEIVSKAAGSFVIHFEEDGGLNCANKAFDWVAVTTGEFQIPPGGGGGGEPPGGECASGAQTGFQEPGGGPRYAPNAGLFLTTGVMPQEKGACETGVIGLGLGADLFTALSQFCFGLTCISEWWKTIQQPSSCKLEVRKVWGPTDTFGLNLTTALCDSKLTASAVSSGWVATGMDRCSGGLCDSASVASCIYTRMVCSGGVTTSLPTKTGPEAHPVSGLTFTPQCNDGADNDSAGGIDYPADSDCQGYWDNSE